MPRAKHILIVPSWYPSLTRPLAGVFIREQAKALARNRPDWTFTVYNFQSPLNHLSLKRPFEMISTLRRWHQVSVPRWHLGQEGLREFCEPFLFPPRPLKQSPARLTYRLVNFLKREAAENRPVDLIHAHVSIPAGLTCSTSIRANEIPWVLTEHMGARMLSEISPSGSLPSYIANSYSNCNELICVSQAQVALLEKLTKRRGVVIPNLVDDLKFTPAESRLHPDGPILTVASLNHNKGIDLLLRAYSNLHKSSAIPPLRIVGAGPEKADLTALAASLCITDRVTFTGALPPDKVKTEMQACSVFVLPSRSESFGVVLIEALACGRPVVATDCGGPADIVDHESGILVPCENYQALAEGIASILSHIKDYPAAQLHKSARARFGSTAIALRIVNLYESLLEMRNAMK